MTLENRICSFVKLGQWLTHSLDSQELEEILVRTRLNNGWFTAANTLSALRVIATEFLDEAKLRGWVANYEIKDKNAKTVGLVMAGNIPAVGFHDVICVLLSGHKLLAKVSNDDKVLILFLLEKLTEIDAGWQNYIQFADRLNAADAYIATGSDNTARYFEHYFAKKPHIIRRNRTSVAVLNGRESAEELALFANDVLQYFGLGCRNVSKVFVPVGYVFDSFYEAIEPLTEQYMYHHKYFNNYEYNRSVYLVNREPHFDNGFLMLRASDALVSPISVLFYEEYDSIEKLTQTIDNQSSKIQYIVSQNGWYNKSGAFGFTPHPPLENYADGVDTMAFLCSLT
jgi:Acyl-CoA reductase (LuxC)